VSGFEVAESADGTAIAFERQGRGRSLVLVGGAFSTRVTAAGLAAALAPHLAVVTYDRRGRGTSGDSSSYAVEREVEDLSALIRLVGGHASLFGHSSGAILALEAARLGAPVDRVVAYEPPFIASGFPRPGADLAERLRSLVAEGCRDDAVVLFQSEAIGLPPQVIQGLRGTAMWSGLVSLAHTLPYDVEITGPGNVLPAARLAEIRVPTLVISGTASMPWMLQGTRAVAAAIPGARHLTLEGADHGTPLAHPEVVIPPLLDFLS
jgi:pimeloyl-ACP methyl ester carboxylesterase